MSELNLNNQEGYINLIEDEVHVIGVGATGSWAVHALMRIGIKNIHVYDFDHIETKNNQNQSFHSDEVGLQKVDAMFNQFESETLSNPIIPHDVKVEKFEDFDFSSGNSHTVFLLTDSVDSRLNIAKLLEEDTNLTNIIETRLTVSSSDIYIFSPNKDMVDGRYTKWKENLAELEKIVNSDEYKEGAELTPCGSPLAIGTTAMITGALAVNVYIDYIKNSTKVELPFRYYMDSRSFESMVEY
jgi:hypothetical protein